MSTPLALGDILEVKIFTYSAPLQQVGINITHYACTNVLGGSSTDAAAALAIDPIVAPLYKAVLPQTCTYYGIQVTKIWPLPRLLAQGVNGSQGAGTRALLTAPGQLSLVATKNTGLAGRSKRGRLYVSFPGQTDIDVTAQATVAYQVKCQQLVNGIIATYVLGNLINGATIVPVLWNRTTHAAQGLLNGTVHLNFGTQRRRGEYGRPNAIPPF
jgi:hypothetical protein